MHRFTLDSASEFLLGNDINSLADTLPYPHNFRNSFPVTSSSADAFATAFAEAQKLIAARNIQGWTWPLMEIFGDKIKKQMEIVTAFLLVFFVFARIMTVLFRLSCRDPIMEEAIRKHKANPFGDGEKVAEVKEGETLLDHLVKQTTGALSAQIFRL